MTERAGVALVSEQPLFLDALDDLLGQHGFRVVGRAASADETLTLLRETPSDVVVLDLQLPKEESLAVLRGIRTLHPETVVVVLSEPGQRDDIQTAVREGAAACVLKSAAPADVVTAVRQALHPSVFFPPPAEEPRGHRHTMLTTRELDVLRLVAEGRSNSEVARRLWVTEQTIKFHLSNVYRKLGVSNRTEAGRYALRHGLISPDEINGPAGRRLTG